MRDCFKIQHHPVALSKNIVKGDKYRITVLTPRLLRLEYSQNGVFTDYGTQIVLNRDFKENSFTFKDMGSCLTIDTGYLHLYYNKQSFSASGLSVKVSGGVTLYGNTWHFGMEEKDNLMGTARTLDGVDGECQLEKGLMSKCGFSTLDDSESLLINEDGFVSARKKSDIDKDIYFFGYGTEFSECLKDYYYLTGNTPMLPRYALGNWWSRYYEYSEQTYKELMERFDEENVPFSVAVIDMDWHITEVDPKYGSGWTGYTFNRKLFPEPERFLKWLHDRGMKVTLNEHPAEGVMPYEEMYEQMAEELGIDTQNEEPVEFDISNPDFIDAYFNILHKHLEDMGVDFWWIDWQQGSTSKIQGLDPLWMLNHYHFLYNGKNNKRPLTFSRYSGPGSHRYPVGFSGDTVMSWESLKFQLYFTMTATNIGYGWWSHDIGGHMLGCKDEELIGRWIQFGVFSPVNRLHSSKSIFMEKEPWAYRTDIRLMMDEFLRLRHRLIPYLYTMNYIAYKEGVPLIRPMYYVEGMHMWSMEYNIKNQYYFGSDFIAAPITEPSDKKLHRACSKVYLPEKNRKYYDFFTGMVYRGGRTIKMYRDINSFPLLVPEGSIIPMTEEFNNQVALNNPGELVLNVYVGAEGSFTMYEDDNESQDYLKDINVKTVFRLDYTNGRGKLIIEPAKGHISLIPSRRTYKINFIGFKNCHQIIMENIDVTEQTVIELPEDDVYTNPVKSLVIDFLKETEIDFITKSQIENVFNNVTDKEILISELISMDIDKKLFEIISEIILA